MSPHTSFVCSPFAVSSRGCVPARCMRLAPRRREAASAPIPGDWPLCVAIGSLSPSIVTTAGVDWARSTPAQRASTRRRRFRDWNRPRRSAARAKPRRPRCASNRVVTGDDSAIEEFCERTRSRLVRAMTLYCGDRVIAEEFAQEALVRCWEHWDRFDATASIEAWTVRVAMNLANSAFRRRRAEQRANRRIDAPALAAEPATADELTIRRAVLALPPRQRAVITARFFLDMSVDDTAALLGCKSGTVKAATSHALESLRSSVVVTDGERGLRK